MPCRPRPRTLDLELLGAARAARARADRRERQRSRRAGADPRAHLRTVLHDARARQRHRSRPSSRAWSRRTAAACSLADSGRGATFVIDLPAEEPHEQTQRIGPGRRGRRRAARGADRHAARRRSRRARRGRCAARRCGCSHREEIALVISDVQMPGANGYELLSSIKRLRPHLPVVLMTAYGTVAQAVAAMREGATDYIVKPFDAQALIDMARRQLAARVTPNELIAVDPESKRSVSPGAQDRRKRRHRAHHRRERHGQGGVRALHPRQFGARRQALRRDQLRGDSRRTCSRRRCSATRRAPSPARSPRTRASSSRRRAARCCSMRSPRWTSACRRRSCACCRSAKSSAWAAAAPSASMCA